MLNGIKTKKCHSNSSILFLTWLLKRSNFLFRKFINFYYLMSNYSIVKFFNNRLVTSIHDDIFEKNHFRKLNNYIYNISRYLNVIQTLFQTYHQSHEYQDHRESQKHWRNTNIHRTVQCKPSKGQKTSYCTVVCIKSSFFFLSFLVKIHNGMQQKDETSMLYSAI